MEQRQEVKEKGEFTLELVSSPTLKSAGCLVDALCRGHVPDCQPVLGSRASCVGALFSLRSG